MQYFGGKARIAKELSTFLQSKIQPNQTFVDLFCGSCNVVSKIQAINRIANDLHKELVHLHRAVQQGVELPNHISEDKYNNVNDNKEDYQEWFVAFVGFGLSYSGKYFGGYARDGSDRNYCMNAKQSLIKKHSSMGDVKFSKLSYKDVEVPPCSFIYCDIPYKDTTKYSTGDFNHEEFYLYAKQMTQEEHTVYVSEYEHNVPADWEIVWRHESKKSIRNKDKVQEATVEVVMTPKYAN